MEIHNNIEAIRKKFSNYQTPSRYLPQVGDWIDGYKVIELLGEGSFGVVYKVTDKAKQYFALKMVKLWEIAYESERQNIFYRFMREFEIGYVESPFLVKAFDCGAKEGNPYIIMELCEGGDLNRFINRPYDLPVINKIAYQVLRGLLEIHNRGFFHRDIKPANILFDIHGNAKVADFGIAGHKNSRMTAKNIFGHVNQIFGTWAYIAPEQANNKIAFRAIDAVADIYSFGITMFELFTGEYPFPPYRITTDGELAEYITNCKKGHSIGLQKHWNRLPGNWASIIEKCIHIDYENKRYQSIEQIINVLGYKSIEVTSPKHDSIKNDLILQVTYGEEPGKVYNLSELVGKQPEGVLTLGRKDPSVVNDIEIIELSTTYISRKHATIEKWADPKQWIIRDGQFSSNNWQRSVNQTYMNSKQVTEKGIAMNPGDIITIGDTILRVYVQ